MTDPTNPFQRRQEVQEHLAMTTALSNDLSLRLGIPSGPENRCTHVLRAQGLPYPRTCQVCRLGPCPFKDKYGIR